MVKAKIEVSTSFAERADLFASAIEPQWLIDLAATGARSQYAVFRDGKGPTTKPWVKRHLFGDRNMLARELKLVGVERLGHQRLIPQEKQKARGRVRRVKNIRK